MKSDIAASVLERVLACAGARKGCSIVGGLSPGFFSADSASESNSLDAAASLADEMWSLVRFGWVGDALSGAGTHDGYPSVRVLACVLGLVLPVNFLGGVGIAFRGGNKE